MQIKVNLGRTGLLDKEKIKPIKNRGGKPTGGLWGTEVEYAKKNPDWTWETWCQSEMPHWLSDQSATVNISENARVFDISTEEALKEFVYKYCSAEIQLGYIYDGTVPFGKVDYEKIAKDYDVINFDIKALRKLKDLIPSLDVSCTVILNKECIESIENPEEVTVRYPFSEILIDENSFDAYSLAAAHIFTDYIGYRTITYSFASEAEIIEAIEKPGTVIFSTKLPYNPENHIYGNNPLDPSTGEKRSTLELMAEDPILLRQFEETKHGNKTLSEFSEDIKKFIEKYNNLPEELCRIASNKILIDNVKEDFYNATGAIKIGDYCGRFVDIDEFYTTIEFQNAINTLQQLPDRVPEKDEIWISPEALAILTSEETEQEKEFEQAEEFEESEYEELTGIAIGGE